MAYSIVTIQINIDEEQTELLKVGTAEQYQPILFKNALSKHYQRKFPHQKIRVQICDIDPISKEEYYQRNWELYKLESLN